MNMLNDIYYGNTVGTWLLGLLVAGLVVLILRLVTSVVLHRLSVFAKKTRTDIDDLVADLLRRTKWFFLIIVSVFSATFVLRLPEKTERVISTISMVAFLLQVAIWGGGFVTFWLSRYRKRRLEEDPSSVTTFSALGFIARLVLWVIILLLILDNLGVDITTLIAGLGIGGIAVALALQNILSDLFASLSIVLDKPFVIGDFIIVGDLLGTVEKIGLKTTRVRSLSGEQLIFSNNDLLQSRIRNYKRMSERRVDFSFGVVYQTPVEKLAAIPGMVREIIGGIQQARFDRAHFKSYGNFSLNFEVIYYVESPDYNLFMDTQQAINLAIFRRFAHEGIDFAYPTQTLYVAREAKKS